MSNSGKEDKTDWSVILLVGVFIAGLYFGHPLLGIGICIVGIFILGWSKRHGGPFPTNKPDDWK